MKLLEALDLPILESTRVVAGLAGLEHDVLWVHIVDLPDPLPWVRPGQLLLTTGYAWPRDEEAQRALVRALAERNLAGLGMAVPHFFEHFSQAAHEEADQVALPLLEVPWDIPFVQITEALHRAILDEQYQVIEQSEVIHRALTRAALEAGSLQEIAATLGRLIQRAITFEDTDGRVLAEYVIEQEEDEARRATRAGGRSPPELMAALESLGYLRAIRATNKPIHLPALPHLDFAARVVCPIRLKEELIGQVWIIEGETPLSELDLRAAEHAAVVTALQIAHQRELTMLEGRLGYTFLDTLLEGRFEPTPHALERAQLLGFDPQGEYRVGLLVLDEPVPLSRDGCCAVTGWQRYCGVACNRLACSRWSRFRSIKSHSCCPGAAWAINSGTLWQPRGHRWRLGSSTAASQGCSAVIKKRSRCWRICPPTASTIMRRCCCPACYWEIGTPIRRFWSRFLGG